MDIKLTPTEDKAYIDISDDSNLNYRLIATSKDSIGRWHLPHSAVSMRYEGNSTLLEKEIIRQLKKDGRVIID